MAMMRFQRHVFTKRRIFNPFGAGSRQAENAEWLGIAILSQTLVDIAECAYSDSLLRVR